MQILLLGSPPPTVPHRRLVAAEAQPKDRCRGRDLTRLAVGCLAASRWLGI
eukprot:SAG31_NODE_22961_length_514_cov_0.918072_1_plen_50_part_01